LLQRAETALKLGGVLLEGFALLPGAIDFRVGAVLKYSYAFGLQPAFLGHTSFLSTLLVG